MMITNQLENKNILYLSARTFNLEKQIKSKLESFGAKVYFYDERLKDNNLTKAVIRVKKDLYRHKILKYYQRILQETKTIKIDYLFVVRGEVVPEFFLEKLREYHPDCIFIFYNWDSFKNTGNTADLLHLYDRKFTFDPEDAKRYKINFRPLYYIDDYLNINQEKEKKNDLLFLGTAHSDRYIISSKLKELLENKGKKVFCYYFMYSKWVYYFKRYFDKTFQHFELSKLSFKSLSLKEILSLYEVSNVILDINHPNQKGLTMRTFEAIGAKRKLITTNKEIFKFGFYNSNNIYYLDRDNIKVDLDFFDTPYLQTESELYKKLSISGWIYNLFVDDENEYWNNCI
ncbi:lipopolysaccharide biosynthesis protein [Elizabethkingia anophelis]|nr:lipopolysaccharide biosynthesis protein [Elizabethkingia anophelis]MCT4177716.1 lipopolysaccharide biosynthesis protein [Elizabethkingia anophelis]